MSENIWKIISYTKKKNNNWLLNALAFNRGLTDNKKLQNFLNPTKDQILEVKISGLENGIKRIIKAMEKGQKMVVYSDYDADGICATAIMWETLYDLGGDVLPYVPHRIKEGYGLSKEAINSLAEKKVKLIITVDHGVTAVDQVKFAKQLGVEVVITDHHVLPKILPKSAALVHTTDLCGAGVSWRVCYELVKKLKPVYMNDLFGKLELAALATIADMVPLIGANRAIVKLGLEKLISTKRPGIKALIKSAGINNKLGTYEISHILAPRINAMGRIEHGLDSLRLLCAKNDIQAEKLAILLAKTNQRRQQLTAKAVTHAMSLVPQEQTIGVVFHHEWHEGIIGLVAARLVDAFNKPMIVISKGDVFSKGSARSVAGFNIVEAIRASSEFLVDGGGHPMAAGFSIKTENIEIFSKKIKEYSENRLADYAKDIQINIECILDKKEISIETLDIVKKFEPYGVKNPQPIFLTRRMLIEDLRVVGTDGSHLKLQLDGFDAIGFNLGGKKHELRPGYLLDVIYTLEDDHYNGKGKIQLKIKDLKIAE